MEIKGRFSIWRTVAFWGWWKVVAGLFTLAGIYDLVQGQAPSLNLPSIQEALPWLDWKIWFIVALIILFAGTLEGTYRYVKKIKKQFREDKDEQIRNERKAQRERFQDSMYIPDKRFDLFKVSEKIAYSTFESNMIPIETLKRMADTLENSNILPELGSIPMQLATSESLGKMEQIASRNPLEIMKTMNTLVIFIKNASTKEKVGITLHTSGNPEYQSLYNEIEKLQVGLPTSITNKIYEFIEIADGINNFKYIEFEQLGDSMDITTPLTSLMLQQFQHSASNYIQPMLSDIRTNIDKFLLAEDIP